MAYTQAVKRQMEQKLERVYMECVDEMNAIEIPFGRITEVTVNYRAKSRWGQCCKRFDAYGTMYKIDIRCDLCHPDAPEKALKETIIHEIIHTCPDCMCHTGEWLRLVGIVNDCYNYNIKRGETAEDKGMDEFYRTHEETREEDKYRFVCEGCGQIVTRKRASDFVRHPELYRCARCKGRFIPEKDAVPVKFYGAWAV